MATKASQKILRVGVIQNGRIIEERLMRDRETVSVGQRLKNTFVVPSSAVPQTHELFVSKGGTYTLHVTDKMEGRVQAGDAVYDIAELQKTGKAKKSGSGYVIDIDDRARGKVTAGDVTFLFQFVQPPPLRVLPQLPANMRGGLLLFMASVMGLSGAFLASLVFSFVTQVGAVLWLSYMVPPAPRSTDIGDVPDRFVRVLMDEPEPPEPVETEPTEATDDGDQPAEEVEDEPTEVVEANPEPTEEAPAENAGQEETRTRDEIREEAREVVRQESALAAFYGGGDDATGPALGFTDALTSRRAEEVLRNQTALGANAGTGIVSNSGIGTSSGAEGDVRRAAVDTGGSAVAAAATTERTEEREVAEVRPRIRAQDAQTRGTGRLDADNLNSVLRRRQRDIERCYERALAQDPSLSGRLTIQFTVGADGAVSDARLVDNGLNDSVGNCVLGRVRRWRFDPPSGGSVMVRRPYLLEPGS